jgi:uncharacterized RDD family membrane protein YckC
MSDPTQNPPPEGGGYQPAPPPPPPEEGRAAGNPPGYGEAPAGQPGYGPGYGAPPSAVGRPADLLPRFLARLIDFILIGIVNTIIELVLLVGVLGLDNNAMGFSPDATYTAGVVGSVVSALLSLAYFTLMESRRGQTVGKMLLKLQTQGPDGATPTTAQALRRNFWVGLGILAVIPVVGSVIGGLAELAIIIAIAVTISSSPTRQGWHDTLAGGTRVVKLG